MQILFVHGLGRTPLSGLPMLMRLKAKGYVPIVFGYSAALQDFDTIRDRLVQHILQIATQGEYLLVGHSLGGILLRSALHQLPQKATPPQHLFLLGSPINAARLAQRFQKQWLYRLLTGDCGQLLASELRMQAIGPGTIPTTSIIGTQGFSGKFSPFGQEPNDGIVAVSEVQADWITDEVYVPVMHTLLPASYRVVDILLTRLQPAI